MADSVAYARYSGIVGASTGVTSLDGLTGALTLVAGSGISIVDGSNTITISADDTTPVTIGPFGSTPNANGLSINGSQVLNMQPADSTHPGGISIADWNTFNNKQPAGSYITALTGDATASGPGSAALTLATVNSNVGTFTYATITVNGKGLITAASNGTTPGTVSSVSVVSANGFAGTVATATTTPAITLSTTITGILQGDGTAISAATTGNLTDAGTDGIVVTSGTGAVLGSGTSIAQHVADTTHNGYLSSADWNTFNGKQAAGSYITALTGDGTASGPGSAALTLATVNSNVGTFASVTVNGKGLVTAAAALSGDGTTSGAALTLAATQNNITSIPNLATVGTITSGTWSGSTIALNKGGTGQTTKAAAFDALQPMTTGGDIIYGGASGTGTRLANGSAGQFLKSQGTTLAPVWAAPTITLTAPTVQKFTSSSGTYTTAANVLYIKVQMVGGGGGGGGGATGGGTGGNTTFGSSLLAANGGVGGNGATPGTGGTASLGSGPIGTAIQGGTGSGQSAVALAAGGDGASSPLGGAGGGGTDVAAGASAIANSGSGGGGGGGGTSSGAISGGGAGGYVDAIIASPSATYAYAVGAAGSAGTTSGGVTPGAGGAGGSGYIIVWEYYQ